MKPFSPLLLALALLVLPTIGRSAEPIRFGVAAEPYPPIAVKSEAGVWEGFDIDLMNAICDRLAEKCEIVETAWDGLIPALQARNIDVIWSSMAITDKRKEVIDFTDKLYDTPPVWIGPIGFGKDLSQPASLDGLVIGTQTATAWADYISKTWGAKVELKLYDTLDNAFADLVAGRVDLLMGDVITADSLLAQRGDKFKVLAAIKGSPADFGYGIGGGLRKDDDGLRNRINQAYAEIRSNGTFGKIARKYFRDFDIYNP